MFRSSIKKRLAATAKEMAALREDIGVLDEQLQQAADEAEDLRLRSIVSETPQAAKEHGDAEKWAATIRSDRERKASRLAELEQKQDELLDELVASQQS